MSHPFQDLFDRVPEVHCAGHCGRDRHETCCGPIGCSVVEAELLEEYLGVQSHWLDAGPGQVRMDDAALSLRICPHLGPDGRCRSYEVRPLLCRLWGATPKLRCPWGCRPEKLLSDVEAHALMAEAARRSVSMRPLKEILLAATCQ